MENDNFSRSKVWNINSLVTYVKSPAAESVQVQKNFMEISQVLIRIEW